MKNFHTLLGAHLYISQGLNKAIYDAKILGCNTLQIFTHSNRQWTIKNLSQQSIDLFKKAQAETGISDIICHSSYLINLGSDNKDTIEKSIICLKKELEICEELSIKYLVLHPGSGSNLEQCLDKISENINKILNKYNGKTQLLIENMAGQGDIVGYKWEHLAYILDNVENKTTGICFDTCHAWAAGFDFSTPEKYQNLFYKEIDKIIGINKIKAMHLNGSKNKLGAKIDRHCNINEGELPIETFKLILNDSNFLRIPKVIETPKSKNDAFIQDIDNLKILRNLIR